MQRERYPTASDPVGVGGLVEHARRGKLLNRRDQVRKGGVSVGEDLIGPIGLVRACRQIQRIVGGRLHRNGRAAAREVAARVGFDHSNSNRILRALCELQQTQMTSANHD